MRGMQDTHLGHCMLFFYGCLLCGSNYNIASNILKLEKRKNIACSTVRQYLVDSLTQNLWYYFLFTPSDVLRHVLYSYIQFLVLAITLIVIVKRRWLHVLLTSLWSLYKFVFSESPKRAVCIVIIASSWSFILFTYIDDARSNTNEIPRKVNAGDVGCYTGYLIVGEHQNWVEIITWLRSTVYWVT
jgi:hypothetical protein